MTHQDRAKHMSRWTRRDTLKLLGVGLTFGTLVGCESSELAGGDDASTQNDASTGGDASSGADGSTGSATEWAAGGTASMTDKASYPDPFTAAVSTCVLLTSTTEGPCTTSTGIAREDVSEGWTGLPVRLAFKVVDTACEPLSGATVKIWHTNREGSYSGQTPNPNMCLMEQSYSTMDFFRGVQTADEDGVVYFDSCFPGWYSGRAVHIHVQVSHGNATSHVSQVFFPEDVTSEIFSSHAEYSEFGQPNTLFASDNIMSGIPSATRGSHILTVSRMTDGAMLAAKVLAMQNA